MQKDLSLLPSAPGRAQWRGQGRLCLSRHRQVRVLGSPLPVPSEPLHDDYSLKSFETGSSTYIDVRLRVGAAPYG